MQLMGQISEHPAIHYHAHHFGRSFNTGGRSAEKLIFGITIGNSGNFCALRYVAFSSHANDPDMTLLGKDKDISSDSEQPLLRAYNSGEAGPSTVPPPSFEESAGHLVVTFNDAVDVFPAGGEEPPNFTPYEAEHWVSKKGEIISHDPHLNEDGE